MTYNHQPKGSQMKKKITNKPAWNKPTVEVLSIRNDTKAGVSNGNDGGGGKTGS